MRIVFLYPHWTGEYNLWGLGYYADRNSRWPSTSQTQLASKVIEQGHEAFILDGQAMGWNKVRLAKEAMKLKPDVVGFSAYSPFFHVSVDAAAEIKKLAPDLPVIGGGPHFTIVAEKAMLPQFDYGFLGEAEDSLPEFLSAYQAGPKYIKQVKGVMYRDGDKIVNNGPRWVTEQAMKKTDLSNNNYPLDRLPLPARYLLPMHKYKLGTSKGRQHFSSIQTMRGCFWECSFCASDVIKTRRVIMKSPKRVVEEMKDIATRFPYISHLYIVDDVLLFWPEHILEIADRMDAEGLKFTFESSTRANTVTEPIIKRLAKSGLIRLSFGLETIDPVMRVTMGKKVPMEAYPRANRICTEYGVEAMNSLMVGLPGETKQSVKATIEWVAEQRDISQANVSVAVPYPGTKFYDQAMAGDHGLSLLSGDFSDYLRYGNAVTSVNDISSKELIELQNWAFVKIYFKWWRIAPVFHKHGIIGLLLQVLRLFKLWQGMLMSKIVMTNPKEVV